MVDNSETTRDISTQDVEALTEEVRNLREQVKKLDGFREGTMSALRWLGLMVAVLGVAGVVQFVNAAIERSVTGSVDRRVQSIVGELSSELEQVNSAVGRAENAVGRAESAAASAGNSLATAQSFTASLFATATATASEGEIGDWTIVVSSDGTLEEAQFEVAQGVRAGFSPTIYKVGDYYATTIGRYKTKEEAESALIPIRASLATSAFPLNLANSCPYPRFFEDSGFYGCFFTPQEQ